MCQKNLVIGINSLRQNKIYTIEWKCEIALYEMNETPTLILNQ